MSLYAFTITPSPYKKVLTHQGMVQYNKCDPITQKDAIDNFLKAEGCDIKMINYELTQSHNTHAHGIIQLDETMVEDFTTRVVRNFGYRGRGNLDRHFILLTLINRLDGWEDYCTKEVDLTYTKWDFIDEYPQQCLPFMENECDETKYKFNIKYPLI